MTFITQSRPYQTKNAILYYAENQKEGTFWCESLNQILDEARLPPLSG